MSGQAIYALGITTTALAGITALVKPADAILINFFSLSQILNFMGYLSIGYPSNIDDVYTYLDKSFKTNAERHVFIEADNLPANFRTLNSAFLMNFGFSLLFLLIIAFVVLAVYLIHRFTRPTTPINKLAGIALKQLKWNVLIAALCGFLVKISFYSSLELYNMDFASVASILSTLLAILCNGIALCALSKFAYIAIDIQMIRTYKRGAKSDIENFWMKKWKDYVPLFYNLRTEQVSHLIFLTVLCFRNYTFGFIFGGLSLNPKFQCSLLIILSVAMCAFVLVRRPILGRLQLINFLIDEAIMVLLYIFLLSLAASKNPYSQQGLGNAIIAFNFIYHLKFIIITIATLALHIKNLRSGANKIGQVAPEGYELQGQNNFGERKGVAESMSNFYGGAASPRIGVDLDTPKPKSGLTNEGSNLISPTNFGQSPTSVNYPLIKPYDGDSPTKGDLNDIENNSPVRSTIAISSDLAETPGVQQRNVERRNQAKKSTILK